MSIYSAPNKKYKSKLQRLPKICEKYGHIWQCRSRTCKSEYCRECWASRETDKRLRHHFKYPYTDYCRFAPPAEFNDVGALEFVREFVRRCKKHFENVSEQFEIVLYPHKKPKSRLHWEGMLYCASQDGIKHIRHIWRSMGGGRSYSIGPVRTTWEDAIAYATKMDRQREVEPVKIGKKNLIIRRVVKRKVVKLKQTKTAIWERAKSFVKANHHIDIRGAVPAVVCRYAANNCHLHHHPKPIDLGDWEAEMGGGRLCKSMALKKTIKFGFGGGAGDWGDSPGVGTPTMSIVGGSTYSRAPYPDGVGYARLTKTSMAQGTSTSGQFHLSGTSAEIYQTPPGMSPCRVLGGTVVGGRSNLGAAKK